MIIAGIGLLMWILAIGTALVAPMNISGDWVLISKKEEKTPPVKIRVEQSGRFARLTGSDFAVDIRRTREERGRTSTDADVIHFDSAAGGITFSQILNAVEVTASLPQLNGQFAASRPAETPADRSGHAR